MSGAAHGRIIAIGDIHGCVHALEAVLDAIRPTPGDLIISLGDFIDTGRESREVVERLLRLRDECRFVALLGNHEEMLLGALENPQLRDSWLMCGGVSTINSYRFCGDISDIPDDHIGFIRECVDYFETESHIFVHAGYVPDQPMDDQPDHARRWALLEEPLPEPHCSGKTVLCGHTEQRNGEILDLGHLICIDTYCHGYGWLTALDVSSGVTWQASRWGAMREAESVEPLQRAKDILRPPTSV